MSEKGKNGYNSVELFTFLGPSLPMDKRFNIVNATHFCVLVNSLPIKNSNSLFSPHMGLIKSVSPGHRST